LVSYTSGPSYCATVLDLGLSRSLAARCRFALDIQWIQVCRPAAFQGDAAGDVATWYRALAQSCGTYLIRRIHCLLIFLEKLIASLDWSVVRQSLVPPSNYSRGTCSPWRQLVLHPA
jgi:hypothetical protein